MAYRQPKRGMSAAQIKRVYPVGARVLTYDFIAEQVGVATVTGYTDNAPGVCNGPNLMSEFGNASLCPYCAIQRDGQIEFIPHNKPAKIIQ